MPVDLIDVLPSLLASGMLAGLQREQLALSHVCSASWRAEGVLEGALMSRLLVRSAHGHPPASWLYRCVLHLNVARARELLVALRAHDARAPGSASALVPDAAAATARACSVVGPASERALDARLAPAQLEARLLLGTRLAQELVEARALLGCPQLLPLHAFAAWSPRLVRALLAHRGGVDADLGARDADGHTPLHVAAAADQPAVVRLLLAHAATATGGGVDVNATTPSRHVATPLLTAARAHAWAAALALLQHAPAGSLDAAATDGRRCTALHHVAGWGGPQPGGTAYSRAQLLAVAEEIIVRLHDRGQLSGALAAQSHTFTTPLSLAVERGNAPLVVLLRSVGAKEA